MGRASSWRKVAFGSVMAAALGWASASPSRAASNKAPHPTDLRVVLLDADGGAAVLFVTPEGKSLLVDTGWPSGMTPGRPAADGSAPPPPPVPTIGRIVAGMQQLGLKQIDYVLITHYHLDHVGGVPDLLAQVKVGTFIDHGPNLETMSAEQAASTSPTHPVRLYAAYEAALTGRKRLSIKAGHVLAIGSLKLTFVAARGEVLPRPLAGASGQTARCEVPDSPKPRDENDYSAGFVATFGKARIMDLGDLTWNQEKRLVCPGNKVGPIDLLLVSHHGSELSSSPPLLEATRPRLAIVGNGARKGGDERVFNTLVEASSKPTIWYEHFATRSPPANPTPERIANLTLQPDGAFPLDIRVRRDGAMEVTNTRDGRTERYPPR